MLSAGDIKKSRLRHRGENLIIGKTVTHGDTSEVLFVSDLGNMWHQKCVAGGRPVLRTYFTDHVLTKLFTAVTVNAAECYGVGGDVRGLEAILQANREAAESLDAFTGRAVLGSSVLPGKNESWRDGM